MRYISNLNNKTAKELEKIVRNDSLFFIKIEHIFFHLELLKWWLVLRIYIKDSIIKNTIYRRI